MTGSSKWVPRCVRCGDRDGPFEPVTFPLPPHDARTDLAPGRGEALLCPSCQKSLRGWLRGATVVAPAAGAV